MSAGLRFTIGHRAWSEGAEDEFGNATQGWSDPVDKGVYGWRPVNSSEPVLASHDRDVVEMKLIVPVGFTCSPRDRMVLDAVEFEVIGDPEIPDHSPFDSSPYVTDDEGGGVVNLKRVAG